VSNVGVLLVDDHAVVREGYRLLLERAGDIEVLGEAADAAGAVAQYRQLQPRVVVMDIALPGVSGIDAMREIHISSPEARVLMFSMYEDAIFAQRALKAGAQGYVTKASAPATLVEAVRTVADGHMYLTPTIAQDLALRSVSSEPPPGEELSAREFEVLRLLVQGVPVRDIAARLGLTVKTVANHQSSIRQKLGVETAVQLLQAAARLGIER
jgi:two-component system, NarL family, invasion response regulator UvrY